MTDQLTEIQDRLRRVETRLTKFMEWSGFDSQVRKPRWSSGTIVVPSLGATLKDCLEVVPADWSNSSAIFVVHKEQTVLEFFLPDRVTSA